MYVHILYIYLEDVQNADGQISKSISKLEFWNMMTDYLKYNIFPLCGYSYFLYYYLHMIVIYHCLYI